MKKDFNDHPILLLTHTKDDCATMVEEKLEEMKVPYLRFNTDTFHNSVKINMELGESGNFSGEYIFPDFRIKFEDIPVVWNRRVHQPETGANLNFEPEFKEWSQEEAFAALKISFTMLECPIVNPWEANEKIKFNKMLQMKKAQELGFEIPGSLITSDLPEIKKFWKKMKKDIIFKKIQRGFFSLQNGERLLVHTNRIPEEKMTDENIQRMRFAPIFLQRHIPKKYDIRSIIVGEKVFSVAMHSQEIEEAKTDFRTVIPLGKLEDMKHEPIDLGEEVNSKLVAFTKSFGLTFSAIDLVLTPDDRIIFLEDNPNGQWAWLEIFTDLNISGAIAKHLANLAGYDTHKNRNSKKISL